MSEFIGHTLKTKRVALGWSLRELSRRSDVPKSTISDLERGGVNSAATSTVAALARALGADISELMEPLIRDDVRRLKEAEG